LTPTQNAHRSRSCAGHRLKPRPVPRPGSYARSAKPIVVIRRVLRLSIEVGSMSPDGRYRWDGHAWQLANSESPDAVATPSSPLAIPAPAPIYQASQYPTVQRVEMRAGAAFRLGFFAFFGAGCASLVFWAVGIIALVALGGVGAVIGTLGSHT